MRLLHRTTRSVSPTELGERLLARLGPVLRDLDDALASVSAETGPVRGRLRINCSEPAARQLLQGVIAAFLARHPEVELDLVAEGRLADIVADGFDASACRAASAIAGNSAGRARNSSWRCPAP